MLGTYSEFTTCGQPSQFELLTHHSIGFAHSTRGKFCEGSSADVSVTALSEQMLYKRKKAKSNVLPVSPMCVVCRSVSSTTRAQMTERNQTCELWSSKWAL